MIVGVTGSRNGLTWQQRSAAKTLLNDLQPEWLHHGDCYGVDAQLHDMALEAGIPVTVHPPAEDRWRAHRRGAINWKPRPYLDRNHDIVDCCSTLVAFPRGPEEEGQRSGTWATVRYAVSVGRGVIVVAPDGSVERR